MRKNVRQKERPLGDASCKQPEACGNAVDFRCAVEDCPARVNPLEDLLSDMTSMTQEFKAETSALDSCISQITDDLTTPRDISWSSTLSAVASSLSYIGVVGFLFAFVYLRSYHLAVIGKQPINYGYLDTVVGSWGALLPAASMVAGLIFGLASLSLGLSSRSRNALKESMLGARRLRLHAAAIRKQYEEWRPRIIAASERQHMEAAPEAASVAEVCELLDRLGQQVGEMEEVARSHWDLVSRAGRLEPLTWMALRLSRTGHKHWTWAGLFVVELMAILAATLFALGLSGQLTWLSRGWAGIGMYVAVVLGFLDFWLMANTADFANGPGTRSARAAVIQVMALGLVTMLSLFAAMGTADGVYAKTHPAEKFDRVEVQTVSGSLIEGYLVPVISTTDAFVIINGDSTAGIKRIPAEQVRVLETREASE